MVVPADLPRADDLDLADLALDTVFLHEGERHARTVGHVDRDPGGPARSDHQARRESVAPRILAGGVGRFDPIAMLVDLDVHRREHGSDGRVADLDVIALPVPIVHGDTVLLGEVEELGGGRR